MKQNFIYNFQKQKNKHKRLCSLINTKIIKFYYVTRHFERIQPNKTNKMKVKMKLKTGK